MAKRRRKSGRITKKSQREYQKYHQRKNVLRSPFYLDQINRRDIRKVEDRRLWKPAWIEGSRRMDGRPAEFQARRPPPKTRKGLRYDKISYVNPIKIAVCARRRARRRTLFARHITGKGKGSRFWRPRIMKPTSYIKC